LERSYADGTYAIYGHHWHRLGGQYGGPIAVALELSKGPIVSALQKYDFLGVFSFLCQRDVASLIRSNFQCGIKSAFKKDYDRAGLAIPGQYARILSLEGRIVNDGR